MRIAGWFTVALLPLCSAAPALATNPVPSSKSEEVRGITLSTHGNGRDWANADPMERTLRTIRDVGANWIAIHPYAGIRDDGSLRYPSFDPANPPEHIVGPIREAHALGLKILIKPHIAYWGSKFSWRGEIEFENKSEWDRFWKDYKSWIVGLASVSKTADAFAVGTELDRTLHHETQWRELIAEVRKQSSFPLTYAANWTDYEGVKFWDALDVIGIQAYFPLSDTPTTDESKIREGWKLVMDRLRGYSKQQQRPIVFTEVGYSRSMNASVEPWVGRVDGKVAHRVQQLCMQAALEAIRNEPHVIGSFLWKWFPEPRPVGRNYRLATPEMKQLIRDAWQDSPPTP